MACDLSKSAGKVTTLAHIGIYVKDMAVSKAFYCDKLGFTLMEEAVNGETALALLRIGACVLELIQQPVYAPRTAGQIDHIALAVEDISSLVRHLSEQNIHFLSDEVSDMPGLFGGIRNIFFVGPDGERLEFFEQI